jgi:hypothetical protein
MGQVEKVIQIVRSYWGRMVDENAATFWETISADFLSGTSRIGTRSHCHAWSAAPLMMLPRIILGVNVTSPGCRTVDINPQPCGLKRASGSFPTPRGSIEVSWFIDKSNEMNLSVSVPEGVDVSSTCPVLRID